MPSNSMMQHAIAFANEHESTWDREVTANWGVHRDDPPPWNRLLGPVHSRGPVSGTIVADGKTLASWGEPKRADLTFSVAKTYLALLAGVAHDRGLLPDVDEPIGARLHGIGFDERPQRARDLGPDAAADQRVERRGVRRHGPGRSLPRGDLRQAAPAARKAIRARCRSRAPTGNTTTCASTSCRWRCCICSSGPLPEVFREAITRPVGASENWNWVGYDNAWVEIAGKRVQSVPGGTHWGGGMSISSEDQALIGQMMLDEGMANGKRVLSADWIRRMRTPCAIAPYYGYLVWLNHERKVFPSVPAASYFAMGAGSSFTFIEPERRLVVVVRWLNSAHANEFFGKVLQAVDAA